MHRAPDPPSWVVKVRGWESSSRRSCEKSGRGVWAGAKAQSRRGSFAIFRELKVVLASLGLW